MLFEKYWVDFSGTPCLVVPSDRVRAKARRSAKPKTGFVFRFALRFHPKILGGANHIVSYIGVFGTLPVAVQLCFLLTSRYPTA